MNLAAIQSALRERNIDAWLFYDHHHRDPIAYRVLGLPAGLMVTRRWFYLIPSQGEPVKLVHKIEAGHLDSVPGSKRQYSGWQELFDTLKSMLAPYRDVAMQYSPNNIVFTISLVDGGTIELLRGLGKNIVSSADLVAQFEATWSGCVGKAPSGRMCQVFEIVRDARDAGVKAVTDAVNAGRRIAGWEVDRATRNHIKQKGFGDYFIHRTGHSIGTDVHSNGANMDDLEIHDERQILPNSCFSIEPGVYLPEFGVRSEVNVLVRPNRAEVTGKIQREIVII